MAFWNNWTRKKEPQTKEEPQAKALHTNAPAHWPKIATGSDEPAINWIAMGSSLATAFKAPEASVAFMRSFAYEDGVLEVPVWVTEKGRETGVFLYGKDDPDAAAQFSGVRALLAERENAKAVYYAPTALLPTRAATVLKAIDTPMFSKVTTPKADARYSLWWATPEDPRFTESPDRVLLDRWFEATEGYGYVIFTAFVNDLELAKGGASTYALPNQAFLHGVSGPGSTDLLLHASEEEGLFLAFDEATTTTARRHAFLRLLADFATPIRSTLSERGVPERAQEKGLTTWRAIRDQALAKEARGETGLSIHSIVVTDGQPNRIPAARSENERKAQPPAAGRELLDFGMDMIDRAVARLRSKTVAQSSQEQLGAPNVFPVIAAKVNDTLYERAMPYEDAQAAIAAAGRVLDEWPETKTVGVLVDAAMRENGQRVDILSVLLQDLGTSAAASLIQRYKTSPSGAIELLGRPTAMPNAAFVAPPFPGDPGPASAPDSGLMAIAAGALERIAAANAFGAHDDLDEPLGSPEAYIDHKDGMITMVLAMQGPIGAVSSLLGALGDPEHAAAQWVVYSFDDLIYIDGQRTRRLRLCVSRRGDAATAIMDQLYEGSETKGAFTLKGPPVFRRWAGPLLA